MAEENKQVDGGEDGDGQPTNKFAKFKDKKFLVLFGLAPLLALLGIGYFALSYFGWLASGEADTQQTAAAPTVVYLDLPEMVVNLSANDKRAQYLKIKVALEAQDQMTLDAIQPVMPKVLDMFQIYLRELRSSDLEGSAGIFRLKEELLYRINLAIHPSRVNRVLFKEILIQ